MSRQCLSQWVKRYRQAGEEGLLERSSRPHTSPTQTPAAVVERIAVMRRDHKWSARQITHELNADGITISMSTVTRWLARLGLNRRRWLEIDGTPTRAVNRIVAAAAGDMIHVDVKKVGAIRDGGGWRAHGRGSAQDKAKHRTRAGYRYLHSAVDGCTRLAYTQSMPDETAASVVEFWANAKAWFAAHGITEITTVITDNAFAYRSHAFANALAADQITHRRIRPYTPRHNGKVERYNRILAEEFLYARPYTSEDARTQALTIWNTHYNYHRPHTTCRDQPPASQTPARVTNVMSSYT